MEVGQRFHGHVLGHLDDTLTDRAGVLHVGIEGPPQPAKELQPMTRYRRDQLEKEALRLPTIDAGVRIGHVHLKVADLQRALDFYCGVLGFALTTSRPGAAFISAGGYHHHLGLNTWESLGGSPPPPARPAFTIPPFSTRPGGSWPTRCAG